MKNMKLLHTLIKKEQEETRIGLLCCRVDGLKLNIGLFSHDVSSKLQASFRITYNAVGGACK